MKGRHSPLRYDIKDILTTQVFPLLTKDSGCGMLEFFLIHHSKPFLGVKYVVWADSSQVVKITTGHGGVRCDSLSKVCGHRGREGPWPVGLLW